MRTPFKKLLSREAEEGYIPSRELTKHAAALTGQNLTYSFISNWMFYFCTNVLKISPNKVGIITGIARLWDAVNDPIVGGYVDKRQSKPGEKLKPYLRYVPLPLGIFSALLFMNFGLGEMGAIVYFVLIYLVWDTLYSFQDVGIWGIVAIASPHSSEHLRMAQTARIGASIGSMLIGIFPLILGAREKMGITEVQLFMICGIICGFGGEITTLLAAGVKERVQKEPEEKESLLAGILMLRHNKILLTIALAQIIGALSPVIPGIYFFKYGVGTVDIFGREMNGETLMFFFQIASGFPSAIAMFAAKKLTIKLGGAKNVFIVSKSAAIIARVAAYFVGFGSARQIGTVAVLLAVASFPDGASSIAKTSLWCDSIDYVEWKTGKRTEGISFSMQNFLSKLTSGITMFINGIVLSRLGFRQELGLRGQPAIFYQYQWPIYMLAPVVGAILFLLPILTINYPQSMKEQVETELMQRRAIAVSKEKPESDTADSKKGLY